MDAALALFGFVFAAFCVWLGVRIVNRRERWAKRTAVGMVVMIVVGYPLSFGPACWIMSRTRDQELPSIYIPIMQLMFNSPEYINEAIAAYAEAGIPTGSHIYVPCDSESVVELPSDP